MLNKKRFDKDRVIQKIAAHHHRMVLKGKRYTGSAYDIGNFNGYIGEDGTFNDEESRFLNMDGVRDSISPSRGPPIIPDNDAGLYSRNNFSLRTGSLKAGDFMLPNQSARSRQPDGRV